MSARHVLIVYASRYGQAAKIAARMGDLLAASGAVITLEDAGALPRDVRVGDYDGVIVGGSIHFGRHQRCLARFVTTHRDALNAAHSAFFSVSGAAASADPAQRAEAKKYVAEFLRGTGWRPDLSETIAGAMAYTKYNPLMRWMIRRITAKEGGPTDTSHDHEMTDWRMVERFVETFVATAPHPIAGREPAAV